MINKINIGLDNFKNPDAYKDFYNCDVRQELLYNDNVPNPIYWNPALPAYEAQGQDSHFLNLGRGKFEFVYSELILSFVSMRDAQKTFINIKDLLQYDGIFRLVVPNLDNYPDELSTYYSYPTIKTMFIHAGFFPLPVRFSRNGVLYENNQRLDLYKNLIRHDNMMIVDGVKL